MSTIDELIRSEAQRQIELEEASFFESEKNLVEIVRRGYDKWIELFHVLKAKKIGCYQRMVEILAGPSFGITTNADAVRKAFAKVREERGWKSESNARQSVPQKIERARYSLPELVPLAKGEVGQPGVDLERPAGGMGAVSRPPQVRIRPAKAPGEPFPLSWSLDGPTPVFQGVELPLRSGKMVDKLRALESLIAEVVFHGSDDDCRSARSFLTGYMGRMSYESYGEDKVEGVDWPPLALNALSRLQSRI